MKAEQYTQSTTMLVGHARDQNRRPDYSDVIMDAIESQITGVLIVGATVCSGEHAPRHWRLWGNSPLTGEFPAQKTSNAENVALW